MGKTWFNRFATSTHSHPKEEIEGGREEEREGSFVSIFPPPSFGIVRLLTGKWAFALKFRSVGKTWLVPL